MAAPHFSPSSKWMSLTALLKQWEQAYSPEARRLVISNFCYYFLSDDYKKVGHTGKLFESFLRLGKISLQAPGQASRDSQLLFSQSELTSG